VYAHRTRCMHTRQGFRQESFAYPQRGNRQPANLTARPDVIVDQTTFHPARPTERRLTARPDMSDVSDAKAATARHIGQAMKREDRRILARLRREAVLAEMKDGRRLRSWRKESAKRYRRRNKHRDLDD
jgi:hypothetical protein